MQILRDQTTELEKLHGYFTRIEELADRLGIDVDDFINEFKTDGVAKYSTFKEKFLSKAEERVAAFKKTGEENKIQNMKYHVL